MARGSAGPRPLPQPSTPRRGLRHFISWLSSPLQSWCQRPPAARGRRGRGSRGRNSAKLAPGPSNKTKAPAVPSSRAPRRTEAEAGRTGDRAGLEGRGLARRVPGPLSRPPAASTGPGSSGHKVSGTGGRTHPLGGIVLLHHSGRRAPRGWPPARGGRGGRFEGLLPTGRVRRSPRRRRRSSSLSRTLPFFVAPVTLKAGLPRARTHGTPAPRPSAPSIPAPTRPGPPSALAARQPGPARPLPRPGAMWAA